MNSFDHISVEETVEYQNWVAAQEMAAIFHQEQEMRLAELEREADEFKRIVW